NPARRGYCARFRRFQRSGGRSLCRGKCSARNQRCADRPPRAWRQVPTSLTTAESVRAGGLMSYGPDYPALFRRAADYVDKILRGTKPGDLPVEQPTKFDLVI